MRKNASFILFLFAALMVNGQIKLVIPMEGRMNEDYFFVNHVDLDTNKGKILDYNCGWHTYDGHQGNDIVLKSFKAMDSGVYILAAAKGKIATVVQKNYDRNKTSIISKGFGNYIAINHGGGIYTYYAHIRTNSSLVKVGDSVKAGQRIALVGSSGNSTDPHLHFEMWNNNIPRLLDPFKGICQKINNGYWTSQPVYDTNHRVIKDGLFTFFPTYDTIREYIETPKTIDTSTKFLTYWIHSIETKVNDSNSFEWFTPKGALWFTYQYKQTYNLRYNHSWCYIYTPKDTGWWEVRYLKNGILQKNRKFHVGDFATSINLPENQKKEQKKKEQELNLDFSLQYTQGGQFKLQMQNGNKIDKIELFDLLGRSLFTTTSNQFHFHSQEKNILIKVHSNNHIYTRKFFIVE